MSKRSKRESRKNITENIVLATATLELIKLLIEIIKTLIE